MAQVFGTGGTYPLPASTRPTRAEWVGVLRQIRTPVEGSGGWEIVQQEARNLGGLYWQVSAIHTNDGWSGYLPFISPTGYVPCHSAHDEEDRDREVARLSRLIMEPLGPKRDFTCPSCHLTERDGATNRPAGKLCVFCRH